MSTTYTLLDTAQNLPQVITASLDGRPSPHGWVEPMSWAAVTTQGNHVKERLKVGKSVQLNSMILEACGCFDKINEDFKAFFFIKQGI